MYMYATINIDLSNVLVSLQVPELRHGVVAKSLVQGAVTKLVPDIHTGTLLHKQLKRVNTISNYVCYKIKLA